MKLDIEHFKLPYIKETTEVVKLLIEAGSYLYNVSLAYLDFREASFDNINFICSDLKMVNFSKALLRGADFRGARIIGANFMYSNLHQAIMEKKQLSYLVSNYKGTIIVW